MLKCRNQHASIMRSLQESIASAMEVEPEMVPFLPYVLQDFDSIGSDPERLLAILREFFPSMRGKKMLDIGCGKGGVCIQTALEFRISCLDVDAIPEFIEFAQLRTLKTGLNDLCSFKACDIREDVGSLSNFDLIFMGSTGPILGDYQRTLQTLKAHLEPGGLVIIDDDYGVPLEVVNKQAMDAGMELLVFPIKVDADSFDSQCRKEMGWIFKRCQELILSHPEKESVFKRCIEMEEEAYGQLDASNDHILVFKQRI